MKLKKSFSLALCLMTALTFASCGNNNSANTENQPAETKQSESANVEENKENDKKANKDSENKNDEKDESTASQKIDKLTVQFVPSREPEEIITATEPLKDMLKEELSKEGYDVADVDISVGTSFEATGEAMSAGTVDIGFIPGGTYVTYDDGVEAILTATRNGLSIESDNPKEWNDKAPTEKVEDQVTFYRGLILAGPSEKGKELAAKVNNGEELTWEDLNSANWAIMGPTSPAGYLYPSLWLKNNYDHTITDLSNAVQADSYPSSFARLATGQLDVLVTYADARLDFVDKWKSEFGGKDDIFKDVQVIGVTDKMMNDTISVSETSEKMTPELISALQDAFINIGNTEEGKEVISIYTHNGYEKANPSDYDSEREVQKMARDK
ncbi:phosphate/phosphite/phosphonate ABC transporter substrate-binding protein [Anaerococcus urinomassiliensis]|uniref:phosphate/phosphite/phosphonate ABC transporter substrate-binding protein n=1 Tax=Anaerococcus urinomassiliensis TaxID=1745712 RepID=UPI000940038C|nr:phosphate/phosphite/phosphonate ABC transporter substrate-binding protein [Anaerococcus urinomassiliensis]